MAKGKKDASNATEKDFAHTIVTKSHARCAAMEYARMAKYEGFACRAEAMEHAHTTSRVIYVANATAKAFANMVIRNTHASHARRPKKREQTSRQPW